MMACSSHRTQDSRIEACRKLNEGAGGTATTTSVDRRQHVNSYRAPVYDSRISCLCTYRYVLRTSLLVALGGERCKKDQYSNTQKQRTFGREIDVALHLFSSLLAGDIT
jgi:hypothetical protein